jgi:histidinol phosphatase-like PHP family hydrolase
MDLYDLHVHTVYSDGQIDMDTLLQLLIKNGVKIVGFADHVFPLGFAFHKNPKLFSPYFDVQRLQYRKKVFELYQKKYPQIKILHGAEIDIYPNGALSLPKGIHPNFFDYLLVSKHHTVPKPLNIFKKTPKMEQWLWKHDPGLRLNEYLWEKGLYTCFQQQYPDIFAHPQIGMPKYMNKRKLERFVLYCKKYHVAIELNHFPKHELKSILEYGNKYQAEFAPASDFHGFGRNIEEKLMHSREMFELAQEFSLKIMDPKKMLEQQWKRVKRLHAKN